MNDIQRQAHAHLDPELWYIATETVDAHWADCQKKDIVATVGSTLRSCCALVAETVAERAEAANPGKTVARLSAAEACDAGLTAVGGQEKDLPFERRMGPALQAVVEAALSRIQTGPPRTRDNYDPFAAGDGFCNPLKLKYIDQPDCDCD